MERAGRSREGSPAPLRGPSTCRLGTPPAVHWGPEGLVVTRVEQLQHRLLWGTRWVPGRIEKQRSQTTLARRAPRPGTWTVSPQHSRRWEHP